MIQTKRINNKKLIKKTKKIIKSIITQTLLGICRWRNSAKLKQEEDAEDRERYFDCSERQKKISTSRR